MKSTTKPKRSRSIATKKLDPTIFTNAAIILEWYPLDAITGCCAAISLGTGLDKTATRNHADYFSSLFKPRYKPDQIYYNFWMENPVEGAPNDPQSIRHARVLALLLAAEVLADEINN